MTRLAGINGSSGDAVAKSVAAAAVEVAHWHQPEPAAKRGEDGLKMQLALDLLSLLSTSHLSANLTGSPCTPADHPFFPSLLLPQSF